MEKKSSCNPLEGKEALPNISHQLMNQSQEAVEFLVIAQPDSRGDRVLADKWQGCNLISFIRRNK